MKITKILVMLICINLFNNICARDITQVSMSPLTGALVQTPFSNYTVDLNSTIGFYKSKIQTYNNLDAVVKFSIDNGTNNYYSDKTFTAVASVKIESWDINNNKLPTINNVDLTLNYNPNKADKHQLESFYRLKNVAKYTVTVNSFSCTNPSIIGMNIFKLDGYIQSNFSFKLDCSTDNIIYNSSTTFNNKFIWNPVYVDEIDIEWSYIDLESKLGKSIQSLISSSSSFAFLNLKNFIINNPEISFSRLTVDGSKTNVEIPNTYNNGYIVFRARSVKSNQNDGRVTCDWTYYNPFGTNTIASFYIFKTNISSSDFNPNLNWNFNLSFAEGGKWQEAITFYDGMYRERQTVANINAIDGKTVLVGETFYDVEGRKSGTILPAPAPANSPLNYYPAFNKNLNGQPYSHLDFNYTQTGYCLNLPGELSTSSGSSRYFSPDNPDRIITSATNNPNYLFNQFIPDAKKYPLTTIDYTADQTSKIARQGGVGPVHQVGSNFDTKYFYGKPSSQEELDRLFGTDVGYVEHYSKNMVVDPNGQATISYVDMKGKTIATSLAGDANSASSIQNDLVPTLPIVFDVMSNSLLIRNEKNNTITGSGNLVISGPQNAVFNLDLKNAIYRDLECKNSTFCADCYYDIKVKLSDDCGSTNLIKEYKNYSINNSISSVCLPNNNSNLSNLSQSFTEYLGVGSYTVSVEISISEDKIKEYVAEYVANDKCNPKLIDITKEYMDKLSIDLSCIKNCDECNEKFGVQNQSNFVVQYYKVMKGTKVDNVELTDNEIVNMAVTIRTKALEECQTSFCNSINNCNMKRKMILNDLGLNGQYGFERTKIFTPVYPTVKQITPLLSSKTNYPNYQTYPSTIWKHNNEFVSHNMPWLNSTFCWQAAQGDPNPYIILDLGEVKKVKSIKTQGKAVEDAWVREYEIQYSISTMDASSFIDYTNSNGKIKRFLANNDRNTIIENKFEDINLQLNYIEARYIKVIPKLNQNFNSMRVGLELIQDNFIYSVKDHTSIFSYWNSKSSQIYNPAGPYYSKIIKVLGRSLDQADPLQDLINNWSPELAEILMPLHPEYCSLEYCESFNDYFKYEAEIKNTNSYDDAVLKGYIDPSMGNDPKNNFRNDPLFQNGLYKGLALNYQNNYNFFNSNSTDYKTINEWALLLSKTYNVTNDQDILNDIATYPIGHSVYCESEKNIQWVNLRNLYLSIREEIYNYSNTCPDIGYIGCAGVGVSGEKMLVDVSDMTVKNLCDEWDLTSIDNNSGRLLREYFYKTKLFPNQKKLKDGIYNNLNGNSNGYDKSYGKDKSLEMGRILCKSYKTSWEETLNKNCPIFNSQTDAIKSKIINDFVEICANSVDEAHTTGSSSLPPGKVVPIFDLYGINNVPIVVATVNNFMDILNYRITGNITPDVACDVFGKIKAQKPFLAQTKLQKLNTTGLQIPDCQCEKFLKYKKLAKLDYNKRFNNTDDIDNYTFHDYLEANLPDYCLSFEDLTDVMNNCTYIDDEPAPEYDENGNLIHKARKRACNFLHKVYELPTELLCNDENEFEVDCELLKIVKNKYYFDNDEYYRSLGMISGKMPNRFLDCNSAS